MIIIIMRHGQSIADILNVHEGRADFDLTQLGVDQVLDASLEIVSKYSINKIYSSTLKRAKQTTDILNSLINVDIEYLDDLQEFNNGKLAGLSFVEAQKLYPKVDDLPFDQSLYEMESLKDFRLRAERVLKYILSKSKDNDTICIVSHGGLITRLYQSFLDFELESKVSFPTKDSGYHVWKIENDKRTIVSINN